MGPNPQETADLITFTEEILNGKLYFLCSESFKNKLKYSQVNLNVDIVFFMHPLYVLCTPSSRGELKQIMDILPRKLLNTNKVSMNYFL